MKSRAASLFGSGLFLVVAPGSIAGLGPWLISGWHFSGDLGDLVPVQALGGVLIVLGAAALLECFVRFAWTGFGTPAPIAPPTRLIVTGLYRHVRNPMYVAVMSLVLGQALLFGQPALLGYALLVWITFHLFVVGYEEPTLRDQFPEDYQRFTRAVPRWIPRLTPWRGGDSVS
jgi:protein-S-isoprenylcysteine O-methyltransferase Ste14